MKIRGNDEEARGEDRREEKTGERGRQEREEVMGESERERGYKGAMDWRERMRVKRRAQNAA